METLAGVCLRTSLEEFGEMKLTYYTIVDSPIDPLLLRSDGENLTGVFMDAHKRGPLVEEAWQERPDLPVLAQAKEQLGKYFAGTLREFDLPLKGEGTEFQQAVWAELLKIPYGTTWSYGELAKRIGDVKASRAVGAANGKNPISIIVPCHRVIGTSGALTGFGGGLARKSMLLGLEWAVLFSETAEEFWSANALATIGTA